MNYASVLDNVQVEVGFDVIATLAFVGGVLWYLYRKIIRPTYLNMMEINNAVPLIAEIHAQMYVNGGQSLRDAINRIEKTITSLSQKQKIFMYDIRHGVFETDAQGKVQAVNRTLCRLLGVSETDLQGNGWLNSISEEWRDKVYAHWNHCIANEIEFRMKFDMITTNEILVHVHVIATPIHLPDSKVCGFIAMIEETIR